MALYDDFPYTNFHSLNLDWIVKKLSELENGESSEESSSTATLARNLTGNYPYTNFHSLNLDWVIRSMLELESDFEDVKDRMREVENEWNNLRLTGLLNDQVKNAILQCFENVTWANDQGRLYYDTLHDAFFPPVVVTDLTAVLDQDSRVFIVGENINEIKNYLIVTAELSNGTTITVPSTQYNLSGSLSQEGPNVITVTYMNASTTVIVNAITINLISISAVYTQSGTVYDNQALDSLRSDLVVTALWDNEMTTTVTDYTLSGTLTEGTSTITVLYDDESTTFDVTVIHAIVQYTITNTLTQCTNSNNASVINELTAYSGTLTANSGYVIATVTVMMGNTDITSTAYDSSTGAISIASVTGNIVITAEAVEDVGWISGVAYEPTWVQGKLNNDGTFTEGGNYYTTDYLPCHGVTAVKYSTEGTISGAHYRAYYDENQNFISYAATFYTDVSENHIVVPSDAYYVRFTAPKTEYNSGCSLTPYLYEIITENTVWQSGKIYKTVKDQLGFCYGATTVTMLVDAGLYGLRGYYSLYDSAKQRTNSMGNTNNFSRTPFAVDGNYYFSLSNTDSQTILVKLS